MLKSLWLTRSITRIYFPFGTDAASAGIPEHWTWPNWDILLSTDLCRAPCWVSFCSMDLRTFLRCSVFVGSALHILASPLTVVISEVAGETKACYLPFQTEKIKGLIPATLAWT